MIVGAVVTERAYDVPAGSLRFVRLTYVLAAVLVGGAVLSGGVPKDSRDGRHAILLPVLRAVATYVCFVILGWLSHLLPPLRHGQLSLLHRVDAYRFSTIALAVCVLAVAEEVFYRGAVWEGSRAPLLTATVAHAITTLPAGNVALTVTAVVLGFVLGHERRRTGGWWAPALTHVLWVLLVIAWLPR